MKNILFLNTIQDKAWKNRALFLMLALVMSIGNAWGEYDYYSQAGVAVKTGAGTVYVGTTTSYGTSTTGSSVTYAEKKKTTKSAAPTDTWCIKAVPDAGYVFTSWTTGGSWKAAPSTSTATTSGTITASTSTAQANAQANFTAVTVNSVSPTSVNVEPTNADYDYKGDITFVTSNANLTGVGDFNATPTTDGNFTITWTRDGDNVKASFKFNGGGSYGGASRDNSTTVSLQSKANGSIAKTCTVTANFPALAFVGVEATDVYATQGESGEKGSAMFKYNYAAEDDFPTAPTLTPVSGSGIFSVTGYTVTPNFSAGTCTVTVDYTYDTNNGVGDTEATLTLTAANGDARSVTIAGHSEVAATDDAKVIAADGTTVIYQGDWATALTKANANAGCTLQLLKDVVLDLPNVQKKQQDFTNDVTLDLNGKTLSTTTLNATYYALIRVNKAEKTLTIKDSKTGGKIVASGARDNRLDAVEVTAGNLVLKSGYLEVKNTNTSTTTADRLYSCVVYVGIGQNFTMDGGELYSERAARDAYGIYGGVDASKKAQITINNGTITAKANTYAYGLRGYCDFYINGGTIHAETMTGAYAYGIHLRAGANATATSGYYGRLTMTDGTIEAVSKTSYAYGVFADRSRAGTGTNLAVDGTHSNQETGQITISGGTIKALPTTTYAYGVMAYGSFSSKDNKHITHIIKNATIEASATGTAVGICANAEINGTVGACHHADFELTDCTVTAEARTSTTAYCVQGVATATTIYKVDQPNYYGEYASAAKITINSGTYTATAKNYAAYAVCTSTRARSTFGAEDKDNRTLSGAAEGLVELNIHGGTFTAISNTSGNDKHTRAISSGGNTTIDGGTFTAIGQGRYVRCIYGVSGTLKLSGITINATSYGTHNSTDNGAADCAGVFLDCSIPYTGFDYRCEGEINNCNITVTANKGSGAYGVYANCSSRPFDRAYLRKDSLDNRWNTATYDIYEKFYPREDKSIAGKCTINGGQITVKTLGINNSFGVYMGGPTYGHHGQSSAFGELDIKNTTIESTSNTSGAYGIRTSGPSVIDNVNATVTATTSTSYGVYINAGEANVTNSKFEVTSKTTTAYGMYANAGLASNTSATTSKIGDVTVTIIPTYNYAIPYYGELVAGEGNEVNVKTQGGNTSYAIYVHAAKADWSNTTTYHNAAGEYAYAATATINGGKYTATASGTTAYAVHSAAKQTQGEKEDAPSITINGGKFWAEAPSKYADISSACVPGYCVIKGGYYKNDANIDTRLEEGYNKFALKTNTQEYSEGYRWRVTNDFKGEVVCKVTYGSTTKEYDQLESAFKYVNDTMEENTAAKIILCANYILSAGNYTIPSGVTLLIPYDGTNTSLTKAQTESSYNAIPSCYRKLTMPNGAHIIVEGDAKLEVGGVLNTGGQTNTAIGAPRAHGKIRMANGSSITLENKSHLYCWGYIVGAEDNSEGTILAKEGSTVHEGLQIRDWKGGKASLPMQDNNKRVFPIHQYYLQNIETPITFEYGSNDLITTGMRVSLFGTEVEGRTDDQIFISSTGGLFNFKSSDATLVRDYDEKNDRIIYNISGSSFSFDKLDLNLKATGLGVNIKSENYVLPITNNMTLHIKAREFNVGAEVFIAPGAELYIEEGSNVICNKNIYVLDKDDWVPYQGVNIFPLQYANETDYRSKPIRTWEDMQDAKICVNGTIQIDQNLYTSNGKANICSTGKGVIVYKGSSPQANSTMYMVANATNDGAVQESDYTGVAVTAAQLHNDEEMNPTEPYTQTAGAVAGDEFVYSQYYGKWLKNPKVITWDATTNGGTCETPQTVLPQQETKVPELPIATKTGYTFKGWFTAASGGDRITTETPVTVDVTYYAQFEFIEVGPQLDIIDADGTNLTINANGWASSGWPYTINDIPYEKNARQTDRTLVIPYDGQPNDDMPIEVKDEEGTVVSCHMYKVPFVYTGTEEMSDMNENSIVFVKSGTLSIEGTASAKEIYVAPGAELQVNENDTLNVEKLVLRTKPWQSAVLTNNGTIDGQVYYSRISPDAKQYYQFGLPLSCSLANVKMSNTDKLGGSQPKYGTAWMLKFYNDSLRAHNGISDAVTNWTLLENTRAITAGVGYEMFSNSKYYREFYFPVNLSEATTQVSVQYTEGTKGEEHNGWNIITSPYTGIYTVAYKDPATAIKVCWLNDDGSYSQEQPTVIPPAIPFSYQASAKGTLAFGTDDFTFAAPAPRKQSAAEALTETEWIHLDIFDAYGEGDETSLFVHPTRFEQTYKTGIDMAKQSLTASRPIIYSTHAYGDMAFAGVADSLLENGIDLVVYSPSAQELTFSLRENKFLNRLEYLWLADNETGERTDLLMNDYTFRADAGTSKGRFVLNGRFKAPQISTGIGNTQTDYNIYAIGNNIAISGVEQGTPIYVFDAVGHMIYTTAATSDEVIVPAPCAGVYMLSVGGQTAKLVINK